MITLFAGPVTVVVVMLVGWSVLTSFGWPVHEREMLAAGIVNAVGGVVAVLPLVRWMDHGAVAIVRASLVGIGVRMGAVLVGLWLVSGMGGVERMALVYWALVFYFPLLAAETAVVAWLSHKVKQ